MINNIVNKIADILEMVSADIEFVYDTETGETICINRDFMFQNKLDEIEDNFDKYLCLPTQYEIDEYSIMEEFAYQYPDSQISNTLKGSLYGKGAFRRFKDTLWRLGIREEWYTYRTNKYRKIAENWCVKNGLIKPGKKTVLLTAFKGTSSEKLINSFDDTYIKLILENDKIQCVNQLISTLESNPFDFVISFGQKPVIKDKIYIELVGRTGDTIYETDFEKDKLISLFMTAGFSVHISYNAGTSFCNHIYANGLKYITENAYETNMIFIHIPFEKNIADFDNFFDRLIESVGIFCEKE